MPGQQAGAFSAAVNATALDAIGRANRSVVPDAAHQTARRRSWPRSRATTRSRAQISGLVDSLKTFTPKTVTDMSALLAAYGNAIDAASLVKYAQYLFTREGCERRRTRSRRSRRARSTTGWPVHWSRRRSDLLATAQGLGGATLGPTRDVANLVGPLPPGREREPAGVPVGRGRAAAPAPKQMSVNATVDAFARADTGYALAGTGQRDPPIAACVLRQGHAGGVRAARRRDQSLRAFDRAARQVPIARPRRIRQRCNSRASPTAAGPSTSSIQHAQSQLTSNLGFLRAKHVNPTTVAADNEIARVDQNGDVERQVRRARRLLGRLPQQSRARVPRRVRGAVARQRSSSLRGCRPST